jgi:hypothetical protein
MLSAEANKNSAYAVMKLEVYLDNCCQNYEMRYYWILKSIGSLEKYDRQVNEGGMKMKYLFNNSTIHQFNNY